LTIGDQENVSTISWKFDTTYDFFHIGVETLDSYFKYCLYSLSSFSSEVSQLVIWIRVTILFLKADKKY